MITVYTREPAEIEEKQTMCLLNNLHLSATSEKRTFHYEQYAFQL